jgi:MFS family permease
VFCLASEIFGRKYILFLAVVAFTLGSILAAVAHGFTLLLIGRSFQGVGGGGIVALTEVLIADLIPLRERGKWFSIRSGTWALGTVTGPLIGGAFTQSAASWRWIFWINLPFCGLGLVLVPIFLKLQKAPIPLRENLAKVDYMESSCLASFLIPFTWGGIM